MEKRFSDIILPPTLFYQTCTEAHRHTYTSTGTLLLFSVMSTHCIHVIYQAFFICELSFSTQYLQIEKQAERLRCLSIHPLARDVAGIWTHSLVSEFRLLTMTLLDKRFLKVTLVIFSLKYAFPLKALVQNQYISYV